MIEAHGNLHYTAWNWLVAQFHFQVLESLNASDFYQSNKKQGMSVMESNLFVRLIGAHPFKNVEFELVSWN